MAKKKTLALALAAARTALFALIVAAPAPPIALDGTTCSRTTAAESQNPTHRSVPPPKRTSKPLDTPRLRVLRARPLRLFYYSDDARSLPSAETHIGEITLLAPQCFWIEAEGFVRGAVSPKLTDLARRAHVPLMPLVINRSFDRSAATAMLRSLKAQQRAVAYMAYLSKRDDLAGFQIDLENIDPDDGKLFTQFVQRAAARLHSAGRLLSVAVVPRFSDLPPGRTLPGEPATGVWAAPFDYRALGRAADFLTLMAYDQFGRSGPPGPIAGYAWVTKALDYAVSRVPRERLLLGLPLYGREWIQNGGDAATRSLTADEAMALAEQQGISIRWDAQWRSPWFQHRVGDSTHTVWFEDERSLKEKLQLLSKYGLRGFAAWKLGSELPGFWTLTRPPAGPYAAKPRGTATTLKTPRPPGAAKPSQAMVKNSHP